MAIDDLPLVSDDLRLKARRISGTASEELTDLLDKLYLTGEGVISSWK